VKGCRATGSAALLALAAATARAEPPASLRVVGDESACPNPSQVVGLLARLLQRTKIAPASGSAGVDDASISDEGTNFRVTVARQERSFADPTRQCTERARHAAVFIALVLDPPVVAEPAAPSPAPPATSAPPRATSPSAPTAPVAPSTPVPRPTAASTRENAPSATPPERVGATSHFDVALGALVQVAPPSSTRSWTTMGGAAAWARYKREFYLSVGAGVLYGSLHFDEADAGAWIVPLDFAAGWSVRVGGWEAGAEIGPALSVLAIAGKNLEQNQRQIRLELGGRAGVAGRFWFNDNFALCLSLGATWVPSPYRLAVDEPEGRGSVGSMPTLWLRGSGGLALEIE